MLRELHIHNYFLINNLSLNFSDGFTLITGETGAGKSMLIGAISLLLGDKAEQKMLFDPEQKCVVEGIFHIEKLHLQYFFKQYELDYLPETIIRREIAPKATRSRAFINDTPVTNAQLKELGSQLIDIHSQHETLNLNNPAIQLQIIDQFGKLENQTEALKFLFIEIKKEKKELAEQTVLLQEVLREQDFRRYALQELDAAAVKKGEIETLEREFQLAGNADILKTWLDRIHFLCNEQDPSLVQTIDALESEGKKISVKDETVEEILERLRSVSFELSDLANDANRISDRLNNDPEKLQQIEMRLDLLNRLIFKYHVRNEEQLLDLLNEYRTQVEEISQIESRIAILQENILQKETLWKEQADSLSKKRMQLAPIFSKKMTLLLQSLGMPDVIFELHRELQESPTETGIDKIKFLFTANKGSRPDEIRKIASGGELSRIMLAIKNILSDTLLFPTMIFDEIDSGISGTIAAKAGEMLKQISQRKQIIVITHLPTIAAFAEHHLYVKKDAQQSTQISVRYLFYEERIEELAQMLSGDHAMQEARETAIKLLQAAAKTN
ncbi:MAG: DNA repair protein RecN [Bacteroidales bacterium]|jgi:DNA repair protein RecN (Recombination protein N)|nr:DNA repair protein RecN [Bacteroidales bacterium]